MFLGFANGQNTVNISQFGAKGDGKTNDYQAFIKAANFLNQKGGGQLVIPKGVYLIGVHHSSNNNLKDIVFKNCNGLKIVGNDAIINVEGNFYRGKDYTSGIYGYSKTNAIIPFDFKSCSNISVTNLEVNGNVDKMSRDPSLWESGGLLMRFMDCTNVNLDNLRLHHAQTDGLYIGGSRSKNFVVSNIDCYNNARQGLSITQLFDGKFLSCKFNNNGLTEGKYKAQPPSAGVDLEPNEKSSGVLVRNIHFENCKFENNYGFQFTASTPATVADIYMVDCSFDSKQSQSKIQILLAVNNINISQSVINLQKGSLLPVWKKFTGSKTTIKNCTISGQYRAIEAISDNVNNSVVMDGNTIKYTGNTVIDSYFPYIQMKNMEFTNNKIYIPSQFLKKKGISSLIQKVKVSSGNSFKTESGTFKKNVSFSGAKILNDK